MDPDAAQRAATWLGLDLSSSQWERLQTFATWLQREALLTGGLGPAEGPRIWKRHIADSLVFAAGWMGEPPPRSLVDLGSGIGLPGIPLAIAWPDVDVTLLDRSGRRSDLARRAVRVLALPNTQVREADAWKLEHRWAGVVTRAVFSPERAASAARRLLNGGGKAVIGLRGTDAQRGAATLRSLGQILVIPPDILDDPVRLLIMGTSGI